MTRLPSGGVLRLNKPVGPTSRAMVDLARRALGCRRIGHAGTLDPFAEGLLLIAWGRATGLIPYLQEYPKTYEAEAEFGWITDTQDRTGATIQRTGATGLRETDIRARLPRFTGSIMQVPPMFSAVKHEGERLYDLARRGQVVERDPRRRTVHALTLESWQDPVARLSVTCEGGTYIRTLVHDLGESLNTGACTTRLIRTAVGPLSLEHAVAPESLEVADGLSRASLSPADSLPDWPAVVIEDGEEQRAVVFGSWQDPRERLRAIDRARLLDPAGSLLALASGGGAPRLLRVFAGNEDSS